MPDDASNDDGSKKASGSLAPPPGPSLPSTSSDAGEDTLVGRVINDRIKIVKAIARGGMGKVYLAEQIQMNRPCAVKVLDRRVAEMEGSDFVKRFLLEASVTAKLTHPNAVTIFDYGETEDGVCWIAMELLEGRTLAEELKKVGRIAPERAVHIARQAARALREAHGMGLVHRDMKPANIFLVKRDDEDDFVKVLDFGLVKETRADDASQHTKLGTIMGSPKYMAPEQIQGKEVSARTDIYSLGAVTFAMLTGHPPFEKPNEMATMMAHVSDPVPGMGQIVPDLVLPQGLEAAVVRCLEKDAEKRFASMDELIAALKVQGPGVKASTLPSGTYVSMSPSGSGPQRLSQNPSVTPSSSSSSNMFATAAAPVQPASRAPMFAVLAFLVVAAAAVVFVVTRSNNAPAPSAATPPASVQAPPPPPATTSNALPPPLATAIVHVETDPPGARIKEDLDVICESTPCDIVYKGDAADASVEHLLRIEKADYKVEKRLVHANGEPVKVKMTKD